MVARVIETVIRDGRTIDVYENGMERDVERGRIVKPPSNTMIDSREKAIALNRAGKEKKLERARAGANAALAAMRDENDEPVWENPGDLDFVEALVEAQTAAALIPGSPYSTKAAEFVMRHTGMDELALPTDGAAGDQRDTVIVQLLDILRDAIQPQLRETVDGTVSDVTGSADGAKNAEI